MLHVNDCNGSPQTARIRGVPEKNLEKHPEENIPAGDLDDGLERIKESNEAQKGDDDIHEADIKEVVDSTKNCQNEVIPDESQIISIDKKSKVPSQQLKGQNMKVRRRKPLKPKLIVVWRWR